MLAGPVWLVDARREGIAVENQSTGVDQAAGGAARSGKTMLADPSLSPLQRILLSTDGTIVQLLEAWFDDPIVLAGHHQSISGVDGTDRDLQPTGDERVLRRRVLLQGRRTGRNYIYADTAIVLDRLPSALRDDLLTTSEPIGRLLHVHRVETLREVLRTGRRPAASLAGEFGIDSADDLLYRVYRVVAKGKPVMQIAEHFPLSPLEEAEGEARLRAPTVHTFGAA